MIFHLGDRVVDGYGSSGTVVRLLDDFTATIYATLTAEEWLAQQTVPFTEDELREPWYVIACDDGGTAQSCESRLSLRDVQEGT